MIQTLNELVGSIPKDFAVINIRRVTIQVRCQKSREILLVEVEAGIGKAGFDISAEVLSPIWKE